MVWFVVGIVVGLVLSLGGTAVLLRLTLRRLLPPTQPGSLTAPLVGDIIELIREVAKAEVKREEIKDWMDRIIAAHDPDYVPPGDDG